MNKSTKRNSVVKSSNHDKRGADRLAEAFPLLFGKTAEERSTIGKYTNKDKLKKRQSVVVGDENSAPSNVQVMSNDAAGKSSLSSTTPSKAIKKRSSFLSMSGLKRKPPQPKLSKTICITSPQPRGVELIEDKKKTFTAATAAPPLSNETPQQTDPSINFAHIYPEQADETMNLNDDVIQEDASQNVEYDMSNYEASIRRAEVVQMTADDSAVIAALRNFISTMESNDREQTKNDSNFQVIDEANMDIASTEEKPEVENKVINEYITLETEIKNAGDDKGMLLVPSIISDSRRSSASSYASLGVNSQRSSLCTEMIPVTDQYVSNTLGDKDVVPPRHSANGKIEKILINPRFMMMNEAMVSGLIIAEVVDRIQFENHTKFIMNVQVSFLIFHLKLLWL